MDTIIHSKAKQMKEIIVIMVGPYCLMQTNNRHIDGWLYRLLYIMVVTRSIEYCIKSLEYANIVSIFVSLLFLSTREFKNLRSQDHMLYTYKNQ